jgi:hypothetical protein
MGIQAKWSDLQRIFSPFSSSWSFFFSPHWMFLAGWCNNKISLFIPCFTANTANCQTVKTAQLSELEA